jgi:hypothetical protein
MCSIASGLEVDLGDEVNDGDFNGIEVSSVQSGYAGYPSNVRRSMTIF